MNFNHSPIGVFDSGVGGISVLKVLRRELPGEQFLYYGDTKNAPYGTKTPEEVLGYCREILDFFKKQQVKAVVIACNTATAAAAAALRAENPELPIIGVEPAIKPAALVGSHPKVLVMATPMTLHLDKFRTLAKTLVPLADLITLPCPGLVELIEAGEPNSAQVRAFLARLLGEQLRDPPDAVVLGCTHYPFVLPTLKELFPEKTLFFDGAEGTARQLRRRLQEEDLLAPPSLEGSVRFFSSKNDPETYLLMQKLFHSAP